MQFEWPLNRLSAGLRLLWACRPYFITIAAVALAIHLRSVLSPSLQWQSFYSASYAAVAVGVWAGGVGPGVLAAALYYLLAHVFYVQPNDIPAAALQGAHAVSGGIYLVDCAAIILVGHVLRNTRAKAKRDRDALNLALKAANMNTFEVELDGTRAKRCENSARFYGLSAGDPGDRDVFLQHIHPDDKPAHFRILEEHRNSGKDFFSQYRFIRPADNRTMWVEAHGRIVKEKGKAIIIGAELDVTQRVLLEEQLAHQAEVLREASANKSRFISVLAHELRNPLAPIKTAVFMLRNASAPERAKAHAAEVIERQASRMERLIEDLLDATRIEQGKVMLKPRPADVGTLLERAAEAALPYMQQKQQQLSISLPETPITIDADSDRIVQILNNLLNNSAKFTPERGEIRLSARREAGLARMSVQDNGSGIPREKLKHVFEAFFQLSNETGSKPGLGIGLALCKSLAQLHGGTIEAHSDGRGRGSRFTVSLPVLQHTGSAQAANAARCNAEVAQPIANAGRRF